jgi:hypothetical protein
MDPFAFLLSSPHILCPTYWRCKKFVDDDEGAKVFLSFYVVFFSRPCTKASEELFFSGKVRFIV